MSAKGNLRAQNWPRAIVTADLDNVHAGSAFPPSNFRQRPDDEATLVQHFIVPPLSESADALGKRVQRIRVHRPTRRTVH